jgi:hypothetical protein
MYAQYLLVEATHRSLIHTCGGYNLEGTAFHIPLQDLPYRWSPISTYGPRPVSSLATHLTQDSKFELNRPIAARWSSDRSAIYRNLYIRLAIANDLSRTIGSIRVDWKVSLMQL